MKQYDVCPASGTGPSGNAPFVLLLQHPHLSDLATIVVAPLQLTSEIRPIRQLRPVVMVESREYVVVMDRMAAIPKRLVGRPVANLLQFEYELRKALDLLFAGF